MINQQNHPLPKKPIQYNELVRIINFDSDIEGMYFLQTHIEGRLSKGKYLIWAYQQDVADDRINMFKSSEAVKKKKKHERTFAVKQGFYILAGVGTWSDGIPYALILPDEPDRLPLFIKQLPFLYNAFSSIIKEVNTDVTIIKNLQEQSSRLGQHLLEEEPDRQHGKFMEGLNRIKEVLGIGEKEKAGEKKSTEK